MLEFIGEKFKGKVVDSVQCIPFATDSNVPFAVDITFTDKTHLIMSAKNILANDGEWMYQYPG